MSLKKYILIFFGFIALLLIILIIMPAKPCGYGNRSKVEITCNIINVIQEQLKSFKADNIVYPSTSEGLRELVENRNKSKYPNHNKRYIGGVPADAWGEEFDYQNKNGVPVVTSYGSDLKVGGEGSARDLNAVLCKKLAIRRALGVSSDFRF